MPSGDFGVPNRPKMRLEKEKKRGSFFFEIFFGQSSVASSFREAIIGVPIGSFMNIVAAKSEKERVVSGRNGGKRGPVGEPLGGV